LIKANVVAKLAGFTFKILNPPFTVGLPPMGLEYDIEAISTRAPNMEAAKGFTLRVPSLISAFPWLVVGRNLRKAIDLRSC